MTFSEHSIISTGNPGVYFVGASKIGSMTLWSQSKSPSLLLDSIDDANFLDWGYATSAGHVHHHVSWKVERNATPAAFELMYVRLVCHALISALPDDAIRNAFKDLALRYEEVRVALCSIDDQPSYPEADLRSSGVLQSLLSARLPATASNYLQSKDDL
jgi:hypothetical protein